MMLAAGLPPLDVPLALLSFNVGVELGQLAFVAFALQLSRAARLLSATWRRPIELMPAHAVGSLGARWLIQRLVIIKGRRYPR
jgi:hypothetical protein